MEIVRACIDSRFCKCGSSFIPMCFLILPRLLKIFVALGEARRFCKVLYSEDLMGSRERDSGGLDRIFGELKNVGPEEALMRWKVLGIVIVRGGCGWKGELGS